MGTISLVRVGGVCAILMVVSGFVARIVYGNEWLAAIKQREGEPLI